MPVDGPDPEEGVVAWLCLGLFEELLVVKGEGRFEGGVLSMADVGELRALLVVLVKNAEGELQA